MSALLWAGLEAAGERLAAASVVAALLALGLALLLRFVPSLPPALRAGLWWLVALRVLVELTGAPALELAVLPGAAAPEPPAASTPAVVLPGLEPRAPAPLAAPVGRTASGAIVRPRPYALVALVALPLGLVALALGLRRAASARRLVGSAVAVGEPELLDRLERIRARLGIRRRVALVRSPRTDTPQVVGLLRSTIVLPSAAGLDAEELDWTLAHELAHVRRRDALWSFVPFVAERLLVFHPLVRYAAREYALAVEAACDAVVLSRLAPSAERYGRLLVRLAARPLAPAPAAGWPLARRPLERRLDMLARSLVPRPRAGVALGAAALLALALAVPVRLVAQPPAPAAPAAPQAPESPESPEVAAAPRAPEAPEVAPRPAASPRVRARPSPVTAPWAAASPTPGARWSGSVRPPQPPRPVAPIRIEPALAPVSDLPIAAARAADVAVRLALEASDRALAEARRAAEIADVQVERARRIAETSRRQAERVSQRVLDSHVERQRELQVTMERLRRQLGEVERELERTEAELTGKLGAGMEGSFAEMEEAMKGRELEMRELEERLEREIDLDDLESLEFVPDPELAPRADPPR